MSQATTLTLLVDDYNKATDFYVHQLELFTVSTDSGEADPNRIVVLSCKRSPCFQLQLYDASESPSSAALIGNQAGEMIFLTLPIANAQETRGKLEELGLNFVEYNIPIGEYTYVNDPFGNQIALLDNFSEFQFE